MVPKPNRAVVHVTMALPVVSIGSDLGVSFMDFVSSGPESGPSVPEADSAAEFELESNNPKANRSGGVLPESLLPLS